MSIVKTASIVSSTTSTAVDMTDMKVISFDCPADLTGTSFKFDVSPDNVTFRRLYDDAGNEISITVAASRTITVTDNVKAMSLAGVNFIKIVSSASETDVDIVVTGTN